MQIIKKPADSTVISKTICNAISERFGGKGGGFPDLVQIGRISNSVRLNDIIQIIKTWKFYKVINTISIINTTNIRKEILSSFDIV